jgi:peptide deformylase
MFEDLKIIHWPDPRLLKISKPVENFDASLRLLAQKMLDLMRAAKGVGLAAPQVGMNLRLFVANPDGQPGNDRVYVNPILSDPSGQDEAEEGCLSLPGIHVNVVRSKTIRIAAQDLDGKSFDQEECGYLARIWQHEFDHLNGTLLTDRMGPVARMANRKVLKEMEDEYAAEHPAPPPPAPAKKKLQKARRR